MQIFEAIEIAVQAGTATMEGSGGFKERLQHMPLVPRQFSDEPLYEETEYPQPGTLDEIDLAVDRGLIDAATGDEIAAFLGSLA